MENKLQEPDFEKASTSDNKENLPAKEPTEEEESWDGGSNAESRKQVNGRAVSFGEDFLFGASAGTPAPEDIPATVIKPGILVGMVFGCAKWSKQRLRSTALGILSSIAVLVVRLFLDIEPTAYLIHSIVVFLDMVLIHLFTNSVWLSVSGELVTIAMVIAFHFSKQTVWELLETTLLAILCSFHLIHSRNKHMDNEKELRHDLNTLCRQTSEYFSTSIRLDEEEQGRLIADEGSDHGSTLIQRQASRLALERVRSTMINWNSDRSVEFDPAQNDHVGDLEKRVYSKQGERVKVWGERFFEHFLDGSAGVMYTSFFGLILDELIRLNDNVKC